MYLDTWEAAGEGFNSSNIEVIVNFEEATLTTASPLFLGVPFSAWVTVTGFLGAAFLTCIILVILCCICCMAHDDPQRIQQKNMSCCHAEQQTLVEKREPAVVSAPAPQPPAQTQSLSQAYSEVQSRQPRSIFNARRPRTVTFADSVRETSDDTFYGPPKSPYHGY